MNNLVQDFFDEYLRLYTNIVVTYPGAFAADPLDENLVTWPFTLTAEFLDASDGGAQMKKIQKTGHESVSLVLRADGEWKIKRLTTKYAEVDDGEYKVVLPFFACHRLIAIHAGIGSQLNDFCVGVYGCAPNLFIRDNQHTWQASLLLFLKYRNKCRPYFAHLSKVTSGNARRSAFFIPPCQKEICCPPWR